MTRGFFGVRTGLWIRNYIMTNGPSSPYQIYKALKEAFPNKRIGDAHTVMTIMWILHKKLGLIKKVGKIESYRRRQYQLYDVVPKYIDSEKWGNPYKYAYPQQTNTKRTRRKK